MLELANVTLEDGRRGNVKIANGVIAEITEAKSTGNTLECHGCLLVPGFIDPHVHSRIMRRA